MVNAFACFLQESEKLDSPRAIRPSKLLLVQQRGRAEQLAPDLIPTTVIGVHVTPTRSLGLSVVPTSLSIVAYGSSEAKPAELQHKTGLVVH